MTIDPIDPIDAFNAAHPPRVRPPVEPVRFAGRPATDETVAGLVTAEPAFRGVRSPRTGHSRTWKGEIRNPR